MKKFLNDPETIVTESVHGLVRAHDDILALTENPLFVHRVQRKDEGKVAIISGGGSGHEPLHAGFVGIGMLDAAIPGAMFTSPTPDPIVAATQAVHRGAGVLYLVKNYTGDVLNFDTAAELAEFEDIAVRQVIINDDVAVEDSTYTAGRRGVAGTVLVEKIAGAAAEAGKDLAAVADIAEKVVANTRSMGVALSACTVPHVGKPSYELGDNEIEIGIGIHGEPGRRRGPLASAHEIVAELLEPIVADLNLIAGDRVIALVNGMGGTPLSELYLLFNEVGKYLDAAEITIARSLVGNYVTSLEMQGASVTLCKIDDAKLLEYFDAPAHTVAYRQD